MSPYSRRDTTFNPSPQKRSKKPYAWPQRRKKRRVSHTLDIDHNSPTSATDAVSVLEAHDSTVFPEDNGSEANTISQQVAVENLEPPVTSDPGPDTAYSAAVMEERAGFYPITRTLFVVQGWDRKRSSITVNPLLVLGGVDLTWHLQDSWFHLQRVCIGEDAFFACTCPHDWMETCVHTKFLRASWEERFAFLEEIEWDAAGKSLVSKRRQPCIYQS